MIFRRILLCTLLAYSALPGAGKLEWDDDNHSYDQARRALDRGEVLPLSEVIKHLRRHNKGDIVATEYEYEFDNWVYEFKLIDEQGSMSMVHINARDGSLVQVSDD